MFGLTSRELRTLRALTTPARIQDFLDAIPINFERDGETCLSPRRVLRERKVHCMEGAMLAALALRLQGRKPWVMDLRTTDKADDDHVIAVFRDAGCYGAISKTNHGTVRFRDPIYRTLRELAISYFHEYTDPRGRKILRSYSLLVDLSRFDAKGWMTAEEDVWYVPDALEHARHYPLLGRKQIATLRRADAMERKIGAILEYPPS
jgi:hypothetical protein